MKQRGFTLYELMIVVAIIGILSAIAIPSYRTFVQNNRMVANANEVSGSIALARSESAKRGVAVKLQATDGSSFTNGWTVYVDADKDGVIDAAEETIKVREGLKGSQTLEVKNGEANVTKLTFDARGYLTSAGIIIFTLCDDSRTGESGRQITVSAAGRATVAKYVCS